MGTRIVLENLIHRQTTGTIAKRSNLLRYAEIAQLVEQRFCKP